MSHSALTTIGILALFSFLFFGKLGWDEYQQWRAVQHAPEVGRLLNSIEIPQQTTLIKDDGFSTNEYSAVVWRYYLTELEPAALEAHFRKQAENIGFSVCSKRTTEYAVLELDCEKGEYELRMNIKKETEYGSNLGLSANWSGWVY